MEVCSSKTISSLSLHRPSSFNLNRAQLPQKPFLLFRQSSIHRINPGCLNYNRSSLEISTDSTKYFDEEINILKASEAQPIQTKSYSDVSGKEDVVTLTDGQKEAFPCMDKLGIKNVDMISCTKSKLNELFNKYVPLSSYLSKRFFSPWDFDKYSLLLLGFGAVVALWLATAVVTAVNTIPLVPKFLEMVGLSYTLWFSTRFLIFKENRVELVGKIEEVKLKVLGSNDD